MAEQLAARPAILDTDTLSHLMRRESNVVQRAHAYRRSFERFTLSVITRYEIMSGLKARRATRRIRDFELFCRASTVLPLTDEAVEVASDIKGDLLRRGELIGDPDILIAATALVHNLVVVTNNERHFQRVPGLSVENWLSTS